MAGDHGGLRLTRQQQIQSVPLIEGQGLIHQSGHLLRQRWGIQGLGVVAGESQLTQRQLNHHPRAGGEHHLSPQAGIEEQGPTLLALAPEVRATAQHQQPRPKGPGEGHGHGALRSKQATGGLGHGRQLRQQGGGLQGLEPGTIELLGPAIAEGQQGRTAQALLLERGAIHHAQQLLGALQPLGLPGRGQLLQPGLGQIPLHAQ